MKSYKLAVRDMRRAQLNEIPSAVKFTRAEVEHYLISLPGFEPILGPKGKR